MNIGIDLDNTVICYDEVFYKAAVENNLIPRTLAVSKKTIKEWIVLKSGARAWTRLQTEVYGPRLVEAKPYPGIFQFIKHVRAEGFSIQIISHKTRYAAEGMRSDLREAAWAWLERHGFFDMARLDVNYADVEFHDTRSEKIHAIRRRRCHVFIDDLPEVLTSSEFPLETTQPVLFDPQGDYPTLEGVRTFSAWHTIESYVFPQSVETAV